MIEVGEKVKTLLDTSGGIILYYTRYIVIYTMYAHLKTSGI